MRILMVSPHPTYSPRGTPISVLNRCRALSALGHEIDLVTYGIGEDVPVPGLIYRRAPVPGLRSVRIGPSLAKIPLDLAVFAKSAQRLIRHRGDYDVVHTHEEAGPVGAAAMARWGIPHVYDMGNDLAVVMTNYGYGPRHPATRVTGAAEAAVVKRSARVIAHFPTIADRVTAITGDPHRAVIVPNIALEPAARPLLTAEMRNRWSPDGVPLVLYTGTLEEYQGLPTLIESLGQLRHSGTLARVVVLGGRPEQQQALRAKATRLGVGTRLIMAGTIPHDEVPSALAAADLLVSPRAFGSNTPLKLFSYLASGRPIVATAIESHTQILDDTIAVLVPPTPEGLAHGITRVLHDRGRAEQLATAAQQVAASRYGVASYVQQVAVVYSAVGGARTADIDLDAAVTRLREQFGAVSSPS